MVNVMLYRCIFCVSLLMDLFVLFDSVCVNCLVKQFAISLSIILLFSVYSPFSDRIGLPLHNILLLQEC